MTAATREYLDPIFLSKLARMELVARCAAEGFFSALHPSPIQWGINLILYALTH